ncbi:hypothetical protein ACEPAI_2175 [Sanghuangporus weigelae]
METDVRGTDGTSTTFLVDVLAGIYLPFNQGAQGRDFANETWVEDGRMLSPTSNATMDSERRSLTSPNHRIVQRRWTNPEDDLRSHASLHSKVSRADLSDAGISTTPSEKGQHATKAAPPVAVGEFKEFIWACQDVEKYLESFTHQVQKLGSAFGLVKASRELHNNLSQVRAYFEENAQTLGLLLNKIKAAKSPKQAKKRKKRRGTLSGHSNGASSISENSTDNFIGALNKLAKSVNRFYSAVMDFEDYNDDEGNKALQEFEIELRVLSGGLEFFSVDGESHELRRFVTARASSLRAHLDNLSDALNRFETIGIPCISFAQKRSSKMLLNAATVATFFAGVAATTLQYSVELPSSKREEVINTLWFISLVLSIGAAITGMLAMTWRLAVFSSPKRHLPWYIRFWFRSGYLVLLIASVIAFLAGLVIFVFDTMPMTSFWVVTACTMLCVLGLASVSVLFLKERYSFSQVRNELRRDLSPVKWSRIYEHADEGWWYWLRFHLFERLREKRRMLVKQYSDAANTNASKSVKLKNILCSVVCLPRFGRKIKRYRTEDSEMGLDGVADESKRPEPWRKSSKKTAAMPHRMTHSRSHRDGSRHQQSPGDDALTHWYNAQVKQLSLSMSAPVNTRAVHLQFSPDSHWLVVCYKYECCVFDVEKSFDYHTTLRHHARNAKQVEWSPGGTRLITRTNDSVKVWSVDTQDQFQYEETIHFDGVEEISDIQWLNDSEFLAIADESHFFRVNVSMDPPTKTMYDPEPENSLLEIYYLYTLPDSELVMIVGARNIEDLDEDKAIDCIIVYEMKSGETEQADTRSQASWATYRDYAEGRGIIKRRVYERIPLLNELESLCFGTCVDIEAKRRRMVISYSDKPPELWTVTLESERVHISLERELVRKLELDEKQDDEAEWGEAFLIGPSQNVVACAEDGIMYFWDIEESSHEQFHRLKIIDEDEEVEELPLISWIGPRADSILPMMATAGKGFSLKIWAPLRQPTLDTDDQHHGPMDDGIVRVAPSSSNGTRLIAPSDSGLGQVRPTGAHTQTHTPPFPTIALPRTERSEGVQSFGPSASPVIMDFPYGAPAAHLNPPSAEDNRSSLDERSSHLAAGSQYCTSPESSVKDEDALAGHDTRTADE